MKKLLALALAALVGSGLSAQITFTGVIEKAQLASFCQEETHYLTCSGPLPSSPSGVLLKSSTLDLTPFEGKLWKFTALPRGVECLILDVIDVQPATATLVYCGNPVPGCPMRFRVGPTGVIGQWFLFSSLKPGFSPIDPVTGTLLLGPPVRFLKSGPTFGTGATFDIVLPPDVSLTGVSLWLQGARMDVGPVGPLEATNAVCFTILGPSPPCISPGC